MIKIFNREDLDGGKLEFWTKYNGSMDDINYFSRPGESVFPFYVSRPLNLHLAEQYSMNHASLKLTISTSNPFLCAADFSEGTQAVSKQLANS